MIEVFNFIYKQTNKVNMSRLSVQVLIIAPNKHQLNQNGLLKFQTGKLEKNSLQFTSIASCFRCYSDYLHEDTISLHFLFSLYIMYVLQRT